MHETQYEALRRQGVSRRSFLQFCSLTAASLGLGSAGAQEIAHAIETKPRMPVVWLHGLECTCCTESFIRSYHPVAKDLVLSMISLDYDDTIMAAAGHQAEAALEETITKYKGQYILAVEGNVPLNDDGVNCIPAGETFLAKIKHVAAGAKAVIGWGSCAAWGCVQAAKPNPTHAVPITEIITDKPIVLVPGCPPIPEVMTAVVTYILTYDRIPPLDRLGRPKMFYGQRIHDKCYRRAHFDAGQFVEKFDLTFCCRIHTYISRPRHHLKRFPVKQCILKTSDIRGQNRHNTLCDTHIDQHIPKAQIQKFALPLRQFCDLCFFRTVRKIKDLYFAV